MKLTENEMKLIRSLLKDYLDDIEEIQEEALEMDNEFGRDEVERVTDELLLVQKLLSKFPE